MLRSIIRLKKENLILCYSAPPFPVWIRYSELVGKHFRENHEDKHKRDAKNGWYRYDSRLALPVYDDKGELARYNIFLASMLVRHSNDGKNITMGSGKCQSAYSENVIVYR